MMGQLTDAVRLAFEGDAVGRGVLGHATGLNVTAGTAAPTRNM
jgi:hypothetical protein